jgi:hypothetical protein
MEAVYDWLVGSRLTILDLWLLAGSPDAEARLHELLEWRTQRAAAIAKGTVSTGVSFIVGLIVAQFKAELNVPDSWVVVAVTGSVMFALAGVYVHRRTVVLEGHYTTLVHLIRQLAP